MNNITIDEQIAEVKRELGLRQKLYPRWIEKRTLKQENADRQMALMQSILDTLKQLKGNERDSGNTRDLFTTEGD